MDSWVPFAVVRRHARILSTAAALLCILLSTYVGLVSESMSAALQTAAGDLTYVGYKAKSLPPAARDLGSDKKIDQVFYRLAVVQGEADTIACIAWFAAFTSSMVFLFFGNAPRLLRVGMLVLVISMYVNFVMFKPLI